MGDVQDLLDKINTFEQKIRKNINANNVCNIWENRIESNNSVIAGDALQQDAEFLLKNTKYNDCETANNCLDGYLTKMWEYYFGVLASQRLLDVQNVFNQLQKANEQKNYAEASRLLELIHHRYCGIDKGESTEVVDSILEESACLEIINLEYLLQKNILYHNLQQSFEALFQFKEKEFHSAKKISFKMTKNFSQLQSIVLALFRYDKSSIEILSKFLLQNCFLPIITKPVSVEIPPNNADDDEFIHYEISYSLQDAAHYLRPGHKQIFSHINSLLQLLSNINVKISEDCYLFTVIGEKIKQPFLHCIRAVLLDDIPEETINEYIESASNTLISDVMQFEQMLFDSHFFKGSKDRVLSELALESDLLYIERYNAKILKTVEEITKKSMNDIVWIKSSSTSASSTDYNVGLMISKNAMEAVTFIEQYRKTTIHSPLQKRRKLDINAIMETYINGVLQEHKVQIETIPQLSALFHNNCLFLANWIRISFIDSDAHSHHYEPLIRRLEAIAQSTFDIQINHQKSIMLKIMKEINFESNLTSIGQMPFKLVRQCMRQLEILKNVWKNVLPLSVYNRTLCNILEDVCQSIIKPILALEDISSNVANELCDLIKIIVTKAPTFFEKDHWILNVSCWLKLEQLTVILRASLQNIVELWSFGTGILAKTYRAEELRDLIRALFQNTDHRAKALAKIC